MDEKQNGILYKISEFIVDKRKAFYLVFALSCTVCLVFMTKVRVNNDISSYLPSATETKAGMDLMNEQFTTYATTNIMVSNITYDNAMELLPMIEDTEGVREVVFKNDSDHYKNSSALFDITLSSDDLDEQLAVISRIKEQLAGYDYYEYSNNIDTTSKTLDSEMSIIMLLAVVVILLVLLLTSKSFMEIPVFLITFIAAAILNMGTNYILGEISFVTKSVAVVLQLALAIDYSIILSHRFAEEKKQADSREAIISALSKAIIAISSSSLTTVAGLAALCLMQLRIGMDLGIVLCKGILCSLISVFFLMPGLLLMFSKQIDKTTHKSFVPGIGGWCRAVVKTRYVFPAIFLCAIIAGAFLSAKCPYTFMTEMGDTTRPTEASIAKDRIQGTFGTKNTLALIVPAGNHASEKKILDELKTDPGVSSVTSLSTTELSDGYFLTDKITARQFAELMDMDYETCKLLYQAYGFKHKEYESLVGDITQYTVEPIDLVFFIHDCIESGLVSMSDQDKADFDDMYHTLTDAKKQLETDEYARMVLTYTYPIESSEAYSLIERAHQIGEQYYDQIMTVSNTTSSRDLKDSFSSDNSKISVVTLLAVLLILLFTFQSAILPVLLVLTIQGSIWINFSIPYLTNTPLMFIGYLVVSSIQMGATIDYAIVYTERFLELRKGSTPKEASAAALNQAFPTILTSGSILTVAGFLIGKISTNPMISSLGTALGRGTLLSILLVMTVLPQITILSDKLIEKSSFKKEKPDETGKVKSKADGIVYVNGRLQGYVNGYVAGTFHGVVKGEVNARFEAGEGENLLLEEADKYAETEGD